MTRRTISIPDSVDQLIRSTLREGESYSAAVARLVELGAAGEGKKPRLAFMGSGEGPEDLAVNSERYLRDLARRWRD